MKRHPKLKGQRLGQVVWNAIVADGPQDSLSIVEANVTVGDKLYYISDEDLVKLINDYLKEQ